MHRIENSARVAVPALLAVIALAALITVARAEPFHPADPDLVLLRVPTAAAEHELEANERHYRAAPASIASALRLAAAHVERGRQTSQPRQFGRAEAILESWRTRAADSAEWHVLLADIHQYRHDYDSALALLDRAIALGTALDAAQVRAHLMRAAIHQTRGEFASAQSDCTRLLALGESAFGTVCLAQVKSLTGQLARAYELLQRQLAADAGREGTAPAIRTWMLGALAEMADRRGEVTVAERFLRAALAIEPRDLFIRLTLADLLLAHGRARDALAVIENEAATAPILLRRAESRRALGGEVRPLIEDLQRAIAEGQERGERIDGRFIARLRLLENRKCGALAAARENWKRQRESADVRLLLLTARDCRDHAVAREIASWRAATRYEDKLADALVAPADQRT